MAPWKPATPADTAPDERGSDTAPQVLMKAAAGKGQTATTAETKTPGTRLSLSSKEKRDLETAVQVSMVGALENRSLGFIGRDFVLATLPHNRVQGTEFVRKNGSFTLTITTPSAYGIPYGVIPRLILIWLSEEAVRRKVTDESNPSTAERTFTLGDSLGGFLRGLGIEASGGPRGGITRLRKQILSLTESTISATWDGRAGEFAGHRSRGGKVADETEFWWDYKKPDQRTLWNSFIVLNSSLFRSLREHAVPFDKRILARLRQSALALDIYVWLTYRVHALRDRQTIPWRALETQFGSNYADLRHFKSDFKRRLARVLKLYPAKVEVTQDELILYPGSPSVPKRLKQTCG